MLSRRENEPLLARDRASSEHSDERADAEDAALRNSKPIHTLRNKYGFWRELALFIWAVLATVGVIILAVVSQRQSTPPNGGTGKPTGKRNLIFMVSDGMGPASLSMTRSFRQFQNELPIDDILHLDQHLIGNSRTRSSSSLVTDSAAGATAFSCGKKTYNGAISMLSDHTPCGTVLEAAKKAGYMTGLVVTTEITDATPACFASHVDVRSQEDEIALQEVGEGPLGRVVDIMLGGGRCYFLPNTTVGGCRSDGRDVTKLAQEKYGWGYIDDRAGFDSLKLGKSVELPMLGLFAPLDIPFEIDRRSQEDIYPSLDEMARTALTALELATKDSDKGFFLMIEGSRIDHAGHGNDPAAQVHEVLAYDKAFSSVLDFIKRSDVETVVVCTSDHETGGLSVARQLHRNYPDYEWLPEVLANASHSSEYLALQLFNHIKETQIGMSTEADLKDLKNWINEKLIQNGFGIYDATAEELQAFIDDLPSAQYIFADIISRRAEIGWSTHGHSAVDVNIYGTAGTEALRGNHENIEVGEFLRNYLEVDVDQITKELNDKAKKHYGASAAWPTEEELREVEDHYPRSRAGL